ncbi:MAG: hypothetical protein M3316_01840 [Actinomycetota bacterium]|nr:hypothetical protein [Actinomycetota bacterium]
MASTLSGASRHGGDYTRESLHPDPRRAGERGCVGPNAAAAVGAISGGRGHPVTGKPTMFDGGLRERWSRGKLSP